MVPDPKSFDYHLPPSLIADSPVSPRDHSKLLVINHQTDEITHRHFYDLADLLTPNDVLVLNQTKVFPARIFGTKPTGGKVEVLLLRQINLNTWEFISKPAIKTEINFSHGLVGHIDNNHIVFNIGGNEFLNVLDQIGHTPIPPYIHSSLSEKKLRQKYQTVYARHSGSAAAPTAGLHFTQDLLDKLHQKNIQIEYLTLHVGLGTFQPLREEHLKSGRLHHEYYSIDPDTAVRLTQAKSAGKRIIAVGTTTTRALESYFSDHCSPITDHQRSTDLFIYPPYKFKFVDSLITNFHLPQTSLLMLVASMYPKILDAYQIAIKNNYRFYSFGDACWII